MKKSEVLKLFKIKALPILVAGSLIGGPTLLSGCSTKITKEVINGEEVYTGYSYNIDSIDNLHVLKIQNKEYNDEYYLPVYTVVLKDSEEIFLSNIITGFEVDTIGFNYKDGYLDALKKQGYDIYPLKDTMIYLYGYKEEYTIDEVMKAYNMKLEELEKEKGVSKTLE